MRSIISKRFFSVTSGAVATAIALLFTVQAGAATVDPESSTSVTTERGGMVLTGRLGAGYLTGEAHEYVYWPDEGGHMASELIWDIDSLYMLGIGGSIRALDWLNFNADLWVAAGDGDGHMEDYDWMVPGWDWTHQSIHDDTDVTSGLMFDINAEMAVFSGGQMNVNSILGYRRDNFEWEARGGSYVYSENTFRDSVGTFPAGELGITYEQTYDTPYIGIGLNGDFDRIHLDAKFLYSAFVDCEAIDQHHMRDLVTHDDFSSEDMWALDVAVTYDVTDAIGVKASCFFESYDTMVGDSVWDFNAEGHSYTLPDGAGAELEVSMFSVAMTYSF